MLALIETIVFVFGLVALGYVAALTGALKPAAAEALTIFATGFAMPALLFRTMVGADFGGHLPWTIWAIYFASVIVVWTLGHIVVRRGFGRDAQTAVLGGLGASFSNLVLLGIPLALGVFGQPGFETLSLIVAIHLPFMMGASIVLFEVMGDPARRPGALAAFQDFCRKLFLNPLIVGILAGLAWRLTGVPLPSLIERWVDAFANLAGPVALFAMGLGLRQFGIRGDVKPVSAIVALKLVLMPALALGLAWVTGLPALTAQVLVMAAALPAGVNPYLIASRFGTGQRLTASAMTLGTLLAAFTTLFWLYIARIIFN